MHASRLHLLGGWHDCKTADRPDLHATGAPRPGPLPTPVPARLSNAGVGQVPGGYGSRVYGPVNGVSGEHDTQMETKAGRHLVDGETSLSSKC